MLNLGDIIGNISAYDKISIQDSRGVVYLGNCADFRATYIGAYEMLDLEVNLIRAHESVVIIGLNR